MATSYANSGGSGNRTGTLVQVTIAGTPAISGTPSLSVDGATSTNAWFFGSGSAYTVEFWFTSRKIIDEAKWYQANTASHGTWKWQGSNDRTSWTDIGTTFTLGGVATQTLTTLAGNVTGYLFYRLFQVTGPASGSPWIYEVEFKIDDAGGTSYLHALGSGNRTSTITTAVNAITWGTGSLANLIDGSYGFNVYFTNGQTVAGAWLSFDFGAPYTVQEARFFQQIVATNGSWKFQGSTNNSTWVDLGGTVTLGLTVEPTRFGGFVTNTTAYRYYRFLGVSGTTTSGPYLLEIEFMVGAPIVTAVGRSQAFIVVP